jgi:CubicO group peptidase (beta-lactamase class C family)
MKQTCQSRTILLDLLGQVIALFLLGGCRSQAQKALPDNLPVRLDALIPELLRQKGVPGVSIAVARSGQVVWAKGYGLADRAAGRRVTTDTRFQIGSVSKTITAWGVLALVEQGRVVLEAPVDRYLKRWHLPNSEFDHDEVTVRRVLSHTAGLSVKGYHGVYLPGDKLPSLGESLDGYSGSDGGLRVTTRPGTEYRYSSGGYTLLQMLIEDVTGESFETYIQRTIFGPLGMRQSGYDWSPELQASVSTPYKENGEPWPHYQFVEQGSGGVYTTASDLARLVAAGVDINGAPKGRGILKPETVRQMLAPALRAPSDAQRRYGLGYEILPVSKEVELFSHHGANEGFRAMFMLHPQTGDAVVMLTNSDIGGKVMGQIVCAWAAGTAIDLSHLCANVLQ